MPKSIAKLSVVIPAYNAQDTVARAINSIHAQELADYEILVVNDGSTDRTAQVLAELAQSDPRLRILTIPNGGPSNARNVGIAAATGRFLLLLDADDAIEENCLGRYVHALTEQSLDMLVFGCRDLFIKNGKLVSVTVPSLPDVTYDSRAAFAANLGRHLLMQVMYSASNKLYDLELLRRFEIRFDTELALGEDILFNIRYWAHLNRVRFVSGAPYLYTHILDGQSLSSRFVPNEKEISLRVFIELLAFVKAENAYTDENRAQLATFFLRRTSAWINSVFLPAASMSGRERRAYIRGVFAEPLVQESLRYAVPVSRKDRLLFACYRRRRVGTVYALYACNAFLTRHLQSIKQMLKKANG